MLFNSPKKWCEDHNRLDYPHEGIDLCLYRDRSIRALLLEEKSRSTLVTCGVFKAILTDYLDMTVIIEHEISESDDRSTNEYY